MNMKESKEGKRAESLSSSIQNSPRKSTERTPVKARDEAKKKTKN